MASTSGTSRPQATVSKKEFLTCAVCLDIFTEPKILPLFCKKCIDILPNEGSYWRKKFSCPMCGKQTLVPDGGAAAFQADFHIDVEEPEKARAGSYCTVPPNKERDLFCTHCQLPVCTMCLLLDHNGHNMQDMAVVTAKVQRERDGKRLKRSSTETERTLEDFEQDQNAVSKRGKALEQIITSRHLVLVNAATMIRDEALASMVSMTDNITASQRNQLHGQQENLQELTKLKRRVQQALDSGAGSGLVTVAREMRCGCGSEEAVQKLTTKQMTTVCRPVLRFSATTDATLQRVRDYMGSAAKMEMAVSAPEVTVVEQFRCREDPGTDVCFVCPMTKDRVWVSYELLMSPGAAHAELFSSDGTYVDSPKCSKPGRVTWARKKNGNAMHVNAEEESDRVSVFAKNYDPALVLYFRLYDEQLGKASIGTDKIISETSLKAEQTKVFSIYCQSYRAFDVDASEKLFVVLEEGKTPDWQRRVQLYRRPQPDAIATYSPPVAPFQPSDVCFYTLGGQEVLLVADELNDAIHVVNVQDGRLSFARYLSPGCPLLVQPTALNTDMRGSLWVACRGGRILTCTK